MKKLTALAITSAFVLAAACGSTFAADAPKATAQATPPAASPPAASTTMAQSSGASSCDAQAAEKKLAGAAKTSFVNKCVKDATAATK